MYKHKSLWIILCITCMIHLLLVVLSLNPHYRSNRDTCLYVLPSSSDQNAESVYKSTIGLQDRANTVLGNVRLPTTADFSNNTGNSKSPIVNPHDFQYIINNPTMCHGIDELDYLIYVHSAPGNFIRRQILRKTWAQNNLFPDKISLVVFFLANPMDETIQRGVYEDSRLNGDIIQEDYHDSYKNLTYKGISALKWITLYCNIVRYVFKTDDDSFVDMFFMFRVTKTRFAGQSRFLSGMVYPDRKMPILRDPETCFKWCVDPAIFPGQNHYPRSMAGGFFIISGDIISEMYNASLYEPFIWIDDVYITGLLPRHLSNLKYIDQTRYYAIDTTEFPKQYEADNNITFFWTQPPHDEERATLWEACLGRLLPKDIEKQLGYLRYKQLVHDASITTSISNAI